MFLLQNRFSLFFFRYGVNLLINLQVTARHTHAVTTEEVTWRQKSCKCDGLRGLPQTKGRRGLLLAVKYYNHFSRRAGEAAGASHPRSARRARLPASSQRRRTLEPGTSGSAPPLFRKAASSRRSWSPLGALNGQTLSLATSLIYERWSDANQTLTSLVFCRVLVSSPATSPASMGSASSKYSEGSQCAFGSSGKAEGNVNCLMVPIKAIWDVTNFWSAEENKPEIE